MNHICSWLLSACSLFFAFACSQPAINQLPLPPSLSLDFTQRILPNGLTFSRNSTGTFVDEDGLIRISAPNVPRFDYDPESLLIRGLLIEGRRTNLIIQSEQFELWNKISISTEPNADNSASSFSKADLVVPTADSSEHLVWLQRPIALNDTVYTFSCFFKPRGYFNLGLFICSSGLGRSNGKFGYVFNVSKSIAIPAQIDSSVSVSHPFIERFKNGYYRCSFRIKSLSSIPLNVGIQIRPDNNSSTAYLANGHSGGYLWGAQLEVGSSATSYIPTTTAPVTREPDLCLVNNPAGWFNPSQGTWLAETVLGRTLIGRIVGYDDPGNFLGISTTSQSKTECWNGSSNLVVAGVRQTGIVRHAMAYSTTSRSITREGLPPVTSKTAVGKVTKVAIGANPTGTRALNAHIRNVVYYPYQLPNESLQSLTQ